MTTTNGSTRGRVTIPASVVPGTNRINKAINLGTILSPVLMVKTWCNPPLK